MRIKIAICITILLIACAMAKRSRVKESSVDCSFDEQTSTERCHIHVDGRVDVLVDEIKFHFDLDATAEFKLQDKEHPMVELTLIHDDKEILSDSIDLKAAGSKCVNLPDVIPLPVSTNLCFQPSNVVVGDDCTIFDLEFRLEFKALGKSLDLKVGQTHVTYHGDQCAQQNTALQLQRQAKSLCTNFNNMLARSPKTNCGKIGNCQDCMGAKDCTWCSNGPHSSCVTYMTCWATCDGNCVNSC